MFQLFLKAVFERLAVVHDSHMILAVGLLCGFGASDDLCGNAKGFALGDDAGSGFRLAEDFHAVPHVIDAEHLFGAGAAGLLNRFEDRRDRQEVVLDVVDACAETDALGLAAAGAVHHPVDAFAVFGEELLDDRCVSAGRAHDRVADCHVGVGQHVGHLVGTAVKVLLVSGRIDGLGIFLEVVRAEQIVAGTGQAVAADAGILERLVSGLAGRGEADDGEAGLDVGIINHVFAIHDHDCAGIDSDGAGEVADVGCFAAAAVHTDAVVAQGGEEVFGAGNELAECLAGDGAGVAVDCAGDKDAVDRADAEQVVDIHDEAVLGGLAEACRVAGLFVVQVSEGRLGAGAVGVNDVTLVGIASQDVGTDLAKRAGKDAAVELIHDGVDFGLGRGDAALGVAIGWIAHDIESILTVNEREWTLIYDADDGL